MLNTAPLTDAAALSAAAWQIAWCEPMSGVLRTQLTKAQAASLYRDLTGLPVQICGIPQNESVIILLWLPAREFDVLISVVKAVLRYTCSVQKMFARECPEYPGSIWLTGRCLLRWLTKGTSHHDIAAQYGTDLLPNALERDTAAASFSRPLLVQETGGSREQENRAGRVHPV